MNRLTYPTKVMNITQGYSEAYSHAIHSTGNPFDYPIDDNMNTSSEAPFYCPCDEMVVKRVWPSPISNPGTNTIWLESTSPVVTPTFTDYVTILFMHPNESTLKDKYVGQIFKRGEYIAKSGVSGNVTGTHVHISVSRGKYVAPGWSENNKGAWVITGNSKKPEECFYVDKNFTTVINSRELKFVTLPDNYPFDVGDIIYPQLDVTMLDTAGYSGSKTGILLKGTKCIVKMYHDVNGLYMALTDENGNYFNCSWTNNFAAFSKTKPDMGSTPDDDDDDNVPEDDTPSGDGFFSKLINAIINFFKNLFK